MVTFRRVRAATSAAVVLTAAMVLTAPATPAHAGDRAGTVGCEYLLHGFWGNGFSADLRLTGAGEDVDGWTVELTFAAPSTLGAAWNARMSQPDAHTMTAENMAWNATIPADGSVSFGWTATGDSHAEPAVTVNGAPC